MIADPLIGSKLCVQPRWQGVVTLGERLEIADHAAQLAVAADLYAVASGQQLVEIESAIRRKRRFAAGKLPTSELEHLRHFRKLFTRRTVQLQIPAVRKAVIFSAQQHTPVKLRKLLGRIAAGVQRQCQKAVGNGKADAGRCRLETLAVQAVTEIDLASAAESVDRTGEKIIGRVLAL